MWADVYASARSRPRVTRGALLALVVVGLVIHLFGAFDHPRPTGASVAILASASHYAAADLDAAQPAPFEEHRSGLDRADHGESACGPLLRTAAKFAASPGCPGSIVPRSVRSSDPPTTVVHGWLGETTRVPSLPGVLRV